MADINLTAIRRDDPYADSIIASATQVAVYKFNSAGNEWEKLDIEGAFFVYSRLEEPRHSFFVMNRLSKKNFGESVVKELEIQCQLPFILFRNDQLSIYGIWFYDPAECKQTFKQLETLISTDTERRKAEAARTAARAESQDVLSLLMKAKEQQKRETKRPMTNGTSSEPVKILNNRHDGSLSVAALFGRSHEPVESTIRERATSSECFPPCAQTQEGSDSNLLRRLMSVPSSFDVSSPPERPGVVSLEKDLKEVLKIGSGHGLHSARSVPNLANQPIIPGIFPLERSPAPHIDESDQIPLMSPMVFFGAKPERNFEPQHRQHKEKEMTRPLDLMDLLTPQSLVSASPIEPEPTRNHHKPAASAYDFQPIDIPEVTPLTKQQLAQALSHLLKTDPSFVGTLHSAYLQSLERPRIERKNLIS